MYMQIAATRQRRKYEDSLGSGIYVGLVERSNMLLVGTTGGVSEVNCIRRFASNPIH